MNLETIYITIANNHKWFKGITLAESLKGAGVKLTDKNLKYQTVCCHFKDLEEGDLKYSTRLWYVNDMGSVCFCSDLTKGDLAFIKHHFVGYSYINN